MADGKTHARDSLLIAAVALPVTVVLTGNEIAAGTIALGSAAGILFSPDLDHHVRTVAERLPVIGLFWFILWAPYERLFAHRSVFTHGPFIGTALRQLYFGSLVWLAVWLVVGRQLSYFEFWQALLAQRWYLWIVVGLLLSDLIHWVRDW